ncbi:hypothetical protein C2W62_31190 [Candidatus Entotheonella serta]|nr:hypothetical protein C2W62_31190 [Candidatus Entotheonella serta]
MGLRAWRLGWVLGCLGVSLLLLSGCDTGREADSRLSRVQVVLDTRAFTRRTPWSLDAQAASQTRQLVNPFSLNYILIEVIVPEDVEPIIEEITDVTEPEVIVEIEVPQGDDRMIRVEAFNPFEAVIYGGETIVDLYLPIHDVELFLSPIVSVNVVSEEEIRAEDGGQFTVEAEDLGLAEFHVDIPPDALDQDGGVVIGTRNYPMFLPRLPPGVMPMGTVVVFESDDAMLMQPIFLTLPYDAFALSNLNLGPEALRFYHLDVESSAWIEVLIENVDPESAVLTVALPKFGSVVLALFPQ